MTIPIPSSSFYSGMLNGYYGDLSTQGKQSIWDQFVAETGITATTPDTDALKAAFSQFIQSRYAISATQQASNAQSPEEIKKRVILTDSFGNILQMLTSLQQTIAVQSNALTFYGKWQQQYTQMMTSVPSYTQGASSQITVNLNDLSRFTYGYSNISLQDIIQWGIDSAKNNPNTVITFGNASGATGAYSFNVYSPDNQRLYLQMSFQRNAIANPADPFHPLPALGPVTQQMLIASTNQADTVYSTTDEQNTQAVSLWQDMLQPLNLSSNMSGVGGTGIPWRYTSSSDSDFTARTEINANLQQYISSIQARRDSITSSIQALQSILTQGKSDLSTQTGLLTSILEAIDTVNQSIFK